MNRRLSPLWRLRATAAAILLSPLIYLVSLERLTAWVERRRPAFDADRVGDVALADWVDRVLGRLPPPWRRTCLKRAFVLHYLLRRAGRPADLLVGVRRDETGRLAAHAWLVREGRPYLETGTDRVDTFQVLATFPAAAERKT